MKETPNQNDKHDKNDNQSPPGELIQRYFLGTISADDMADLDQHLQNNQELRATFAAAARLDTNLRDAASSFSLADEQHVESILGKTSAPASRRLWIGLAAAAGLLLGVIVFSQFRPASKTNQEPPASIARIAELNGAVSWIADGKPTEQRLEARSELTAGTLDMSSLMASAKVIFHDGTSMWVSGPAVVTLSDGDAGKLIRIREGDLSLDVSTQPAGKPMRLVTASAEAVVLGTQFNLSANASATRLAVNEGRVRVTRLADGSVQEVDADHQVVAALEQKNEFKAQRRGEPVRIWTSNLPRDARQGEWQQRSNALRAEAHLFQGSHGEQIDPILLHSAVVAPSDIPPVLLSEGARVRIKGKIDRSFWVSMGFGSHHARGGFAGKFETGLQVEMDSTADGRFEIERSVDEFTSMRSHFPESAVGHELIWFWVQTVEQDVGLELFSVELLSPEPISNPNKK